MSFKKIPLFMSFMLLAGAAFAQQRPADLTVTKSGSGEEAGMFRTIQAAVNAAQPGQIIEIQDSEIYAEQVTIYGLENCPWPGVTGGKNGITLRARAGFKPTIKWQDRANQSPKTYQESLVQGETVGTSGNFETCGALRVLRAQGVTIDGIIIDGDGAAPFGYGSIWEQRHPLFHGNAAITLAISSNVTIKNCEIKNAYFGVNVKDRNTGGVYGNQNPGDNDNTIPMSKFGQVGGHLIEYNRVYGNSLAFFFESAWDLGSSVRYNLVYSNYHRPATMTALAALPDPGNRMCGAFLFKDMIYSPLAIYNNTFFDNYAIFFGDWQVGAPHLIFNNIYGRRSTVTISAPFNNIDGQLMDRYFPNRTNNSVYSAIAELKAETRYVSGCRDVTLNPQIHGQNIMGITQVRIYNSFPEPPSGTTTVDCLPPVTGTATTTEFKAQGGLLSNATFPAAANLRWLETSRSVDGTEDLFVSTDPASADFLRPKWTATGVPGDLVREFLQNQGWPAIGIRNSDGKIADIGAIPSTGRPPATVARIKPSNVVLINGSGSSTTATAAFYITLDQGELNNPKIKFMRWVSPLPDVTGNWGGTDATLPAASIRNIDLTQPAIANATLNVGGNNRLTVSVPAVAGAGQTYGFFEMVIEGTDAKGDLVATDVGFLPYRTLQNFLTFEVFPATGTMGTPLKEVRAGETYRLRVTPTSATLTAGILNEVTYNLISDATAFMTCMGGCPTGVAGNGPNLPLTADNNLTLPGGKIYQVMFTKAGEEVIMGAGRIGELVFLGSNDIRVRPGDPDRVVFISPIPKSQLPPGTQAQIINRGADFEVLIEVQDRFGNAVDQAVTVTVNPEHPNIGDIGAPGATLAVKTAQTASSTGRATFTARVTNGQPGNTFDMKATITLPGGGDKTDIGALRVGRTLDRLLVFYADTGSGGPAWNTYYNPDVGIKGVTGDWFKVTIKAVSPDTVMTSKNGCVSVEPVLGLVMATAPNGASQTTFTMTNGVASLWLSTAPGLQTPIIDATLIVTMMQAGCAVQDNGIQPGDRSDISFEVPTSDVYNSIVFGDGNGRPDSVYVYYAMDRSSFIDSPELLPKSAMLKWPTVADPGATVGAGMISAVNDSVVRIDFRGAATAPQGSLLPSGFTNISANNGMGLLTLYGGLLADAGNEYIEVLDGIGIIIADGAEVPGRMSPMIVENLDPGVTADTLIVQLSEQMFDPGPPAPMPLEGANTVFYTTTPNTPAAGGTALNIAAAILDVSAPNSYKLVLAPASQVPAVGDWIRINPAALTVADRAGNAPHVNNRWVQLIERPTPPGITGGYYTSADNTGTLEYAYISFNKAVDIAWFSGATFTFGSNRNEQVVVPADPSGFISMDPGDPTNKTIRFDLSKVPWYQNVIMTSGACTGLRIQFGSNPLVADWGELMPQTSIIDRARPVLADTVRLKVGAVGENEGDPDAPDTLVLVFSETVPDVILNGAANPVIIVRDGTGGTLIPTLRDPQIGTVTVNGTVYYRVSYVVAVDIPSAQFPATGDWVYINPTAGVSDAAVPQPNVQDQANNKRQPLKIERGPLRWKVDMASNPARSGGSPTRVTLTPGAKGATVHIDATVQIFNNMGNVVFKKEMQESNLLSFSWDGYNSKGRMAGTGTYLLRIKCNAVVTGENSIDGMGEKARPYTMSRPIGFIRGKR
ncbi:MAG: hypothetical protein FWB85_06080 [Chitinispirillia bacterium]|nr:hypothetical protein [Chitinispirillia bacterium]MCL2241194.1 hypothetical protein [Chitinispirillia bacterium]